MAGTIRKRRWTTRKGETELLLLEAWYIAKFRPPRNRELARSARAAARQARPNTASVLGE
jgi:hypothetical protein